MRFSDCTRARLLKISSVLLCLPAYGASVAQLQIATPIKDAPFTATTTVVRTTPDKTMTFVEIMARRSDGSIYETIGDGFAIIRDYTRHISISLYPTRNIYVSVPFDLEADIRPPITAEQYLKQEGGGGAKRTINDQQTTMLGLRTIESIDTVGSALTYPSGRTIERWYSPALDINLETTAHSTGEDSHTALSQIKLGEPDPKLFELPAGYVEDKSAPTTFVPVK